MDLLTTILTCSLYLTDDGLVRAIAEANSQSNPYFVLDATVDLTQIDPPPPPKSAEEALARATETLAKGGRPLLGLLQVPPAWLGAFGRELADGFDACTNIAVGTAMLSQFDAECAALSAPKSRPRAQIEPATQRTPSAARRRCVMRKYEDAIGLADFAAMATLELRYQRLKEAPVADAPIFPLPSARSWGPDQLLVPVSPAKFLPLAAASRSGP